MRAIEQMGCVSGYDKLGRRADAEAAMAKMKAANGVAAAYQYATIYAQWGDAPKVTGMALKFPN